MKKFLEVVKDAPYAENFTVDLSNYQYKNGTKKLTRDKVKGKAHLPQAHEKLEIK